MPPSRIAVTFADGLVGTVDLSALMGGPDAGVFAALREADIFARVYVDHGAVTWPGDIDLAPDALHAQVSKRKGP